VGLALTLQTGRFDIFVEIRFQSVVRGHFVALAAFLVQANPPALALRVVVLDTHTHHRAYAPKPPAVSDDRQA